MEMVKRKTPKYVVVNIGEAQALLVHCAICLTQYFRTKQQLKEKSSVDFCGVCAKLTVFKPVEKSKVIKF